MKKIFGFLMVVVSASLMLQGCCLMFQCEQKADGAEWRNGVYFPTRPGDPMYSYYTGDYGNQYNVVRHAQPRYNYVPPRHNYTPRYNYSPSRNYYVPPRNYYVPRYEPHYHYTPPYFGRPNVNVYGGGHGGVDIGSIHVRW